MAILVGMAGDLKGKTFPVEKERVSIGRVADNDIVVDHPTVSSHHCVIEQEDGRFLLKDLESLNGTQVNSRRIQEAKLRAKDLIQVGAIEFMFDGVVSAPEDEPEHIKTDVEVSSGPLETPETFTSISPFGGRRRESEGIWVFLLVIFAVIALAVAGLAIYKLLVA